MKILEIKNNLVKISYVPQDNLVISGFVIIEDSQSAYVAQVMSLKADSGINYAIVKLLFTFNNEGVVKNYNGSIPGLDANISTLVSEELLDILPVETPLTIGKLAQQTFVLKIDFSVLEKNLLICSDDTENTNILLSNLAKQITDNGSKSVIFDTVGNINAENKLTFGKDLKLPLNYDTINFIYEHDLTDVEPKSKAIIQDIFLEVQEYADTLIDKFIPFESFIKVVDSQYHKLKLPELAILKARLLKYRDDNAFAQNASEFQSLRASVRANMSTLIDISSADSTLQKMIISYVYDEIVNTDLYVYSIVKLDNDNSDKKLMKKLLAQEKIYTTIACPHNYKYIHELKDLSQNVIMFAPQTVQHDFAAYNVYLNKLNPDECLICGKATQNIPLIIEMMTLEDLDDFVASFVPEKQGDNLVPVDEFEQASDTYSQETMLDDNAPAENIEVETEGETLADDGNIEQENEITDEGVVSDVEDVEEEDVNIQQESSDDISIEVTDEFTDNIEEQPAATDDDIFDFDTAKEDTINIDEAGISDDAALDDIVIPEPTLEEIKEESLEEPSFDIPDANILNEFQELDMNINESENSEEDRLTEADLDFIESAEPIVDTEINDILEPAEKEDNVLDFSADIINEEKDEKIVDEEETPLIIDEEPQIEEISEDNNFEEVSEMQEQPEISENVEDENSILADINEFSQDIDEFSDNQENIEENLDQNIVYEEKQQSEEISELGIEQEPVADFDEFLSKPEDNGIELQEPVVEEYSDNSENNNEFENVENIENIEEVNTENILGEDQSDVVPVYPAEEDTPVMGEQALFETGDRVRHPKYGEGVVEKMVKFGDKVLCSINFANGRRLLDPTISQIQKI